MLFLQLFWLFYLFIALLFLLLFFNVFLLFLINFLLFFITYRICLIFLFFINFRFFFFFFAINWVFISIKGILFLIKIAQTILKLIIYPLWYCSFNFAWAYNLMNNKLFIYYQFFAFLTANCSRLTLLVMQVVLFMRNIHLTILT